MGRPLAGVFSPLPLPAASLPTWLWGWVLGPANWKMGSGLLPLPEPERQKLPVTWWCLMSAMLSRPLPRRLWKLRCWGCLSAARLAWGVGAAGAVLAGLVSA